MACLFLDLLFKGFLSLFLRLHELMMEAGGRLAFPSEGARECRKAFAWFRVRGFLRERLSFFVGFPFFQALCPD